MRSPRVIGIHPIVAAEPVHLIEIELGEESGEINWCAFTQPWADYDQSYWQVPYDERPVPGRSGHWCFFFHHLDQQQPLLSPAGPMKLPAETPVPAHLRYISYEEP